MTVSVRTQRARTLRRNETDAEYRLWYELRNGRLNSFKFVRQYPIGRFIVDFACRSRGLVVELDGSQHAMSPTDGRRTRYLNAKSYAVLRFWNEEVLRERSAVCQTILDVLQGRITERSDGAGFLHGLRFWPSDSGPSPVGSAAAARPPSPAGGRGMAPCPIPADAKGTREAPTRSSPQGGEGGPEGRMRGSAEGPQSCWKRP